MGISQNEKMIEFSKMVRIIGILKNGKTLEFSKNPINAGNFQKLNILGEFLVLGWIPVID